MLLRRPWILGFCACSVFPDHAVLPGGSAGASGDGVGQGGHAGSAFGGRGGSAGIAQGGTDDSGAGGLIAGGSAGDGGSPDVGGDGGSPDVGGDGGSPDGGGGKSPTGGVSFGGASGTAGDGQGTMGGAPTTDAGAGGVATGGCAGALQYEVLPDGDAWITEAEPKANFGTAVDLQIGTVAAEEARILVRFDLAVVPAETRVGRASLELELRSSTGESREIAAHALEQSWDERRVTWLLARPSANWAPPGARPSVDPSDVLAVALGTAAGSRLSWDVAPDVQNALDARDSTVAWLLSEQGTNLPRIAFAARELAGRAPRLRIETCPLATPGLEE